MTELRKHVLWPKVREERRRQRLAGCIAGAILALALLALVDGLQSRMRTGTNDLEFIPDQSIVLSGPVAIKTPIPSDVRVRFQPDDAPFQFALEGFYTGYWFGSGMWRGKLRCLPHAEPGHYTFNLSFRGTSANAVQKYDLQVYADAFAQRSASRSYLNRFASVNPFIWAAIFGACGLCCGVVTYVFGWRLAHYLRRLGLAEVYARRGNYIFCLSQKAIAPGVLCSMLNDQGEKIGEVRVDGWIKGKIRLTWPADQPLPRDVLISLRSPENNTGDQNS